MSETTCSWSSAVDALRALRVGVRLPLTGCTAFTASLHPRAVHGGSQSYPNSGILRRGMMSALGQKQTYAVQNGTSALPPKADICGAQAHVRYGTQTGHLVSGITIYFGS